MELWIRSQDKEGLIKVNEKVCIMNYGDEYFVPILADDLLVASYRTKERALEVLDEIENILKPKIKYTKGKINGSFNGVVIRNEDTTEIKEFSTFVYEMPEK